MSGTRFIIGSNFEDRHLIQVDGQAAVAQYDRLRELLAARAPRFAGMFAEPVLDTRDNAPPSRASWYGPANEDPRPLETLPAAQRIAAETALRESLSELMPLCADPVLGPLLRAALAIPRTEDVLWTGTGPLIVNWGIAPAAVGDDRDALARHFDATLGPFAPPGTNPWTTPPPARPSPPPTGLPGGTGNPPPPPPPVEPYIALPPDRTPGWLSGMGAIAAAIAIILLVCLVSVAAGYYWGWTRLVTEMRASAGPAPDPSVDLELRHVQESINDGLRRRIAMLERSMQGDICAAAAGPLPATPAVPGQARGTPGAPGQTPAGPQSRPVDPQILPPPADSQPVQREPDRPGDPPQQTNLADLLEASVVMVIGEMRRPNGERGLSMGSGFAVSADRLVTNRHVVEGVAAGKLFVVNTKLGHPVPADVLATTEGSDIGQPDFALLKLSEGQLQPLTLTRGADRLASVVAVGFPGFVMETADDFNRLLHGGAGAMPSPIFTSGEISALQEMRGSRVVVHTAAINHGNSGGPLSDRCGRVVGVNTFIRTDHEVAYRIDYALPSATLLTFLTAHGVTAKQLETPCQPAPALSAAPAQTPMPRAELSTPPTGSSTPSAGPSAPPGGPSIPPAGPSPPAGGSPGPSRGSSPPPPGPTPAAAPGGRH